MDRIQKTKQILYQHQDISWITIYICEKNSYIKRYKYRILIRRPSTHHIYASIYTGADGKTSKSGKTEGDKTE